MHGCRNRRCALELVSDGVLLRARAFAAHAHARRSRSSAARRSSRWCRRLPTISTRSARARRSSRFPRSPTRRKRERLPRVADSTSVDAEAIVALAPERRRRHSGAIATRRAAAARARHGRAATRRYVRRDLRELARDRRADRAPARSRRDDRAPAARNRRAARAHATRSCASPSVFVVLGSGPIWTAGADSYISELIALAGGKNAASDLRAAYGEYSAEALLARSTRPARRRSGDASRRGARSGAVAQSARGAVASRLHRRSARHHRAARDRATTKALRGSSNGSTPLAR